MPVVGARGLEPFSATRRPNSLMTTTVTFQFCWITSRVEGLRDRLQGRSSSVAIVPRSCPDGVRVPTALVDRDGFNADIGLDECRGLLRAFWKLLVV